MPITPTSTLSKNYQALGIDEIANDIETAFTTINATDDALVVLEAQVNAMPGADSTTVEVNISSAQILAMGVTEIELLPVLPSTQYYRNISVILEYTHVTTPYTIAAGDMLYIWSNEADIFPLIKGTLITQASNNLAETGPLGGPNLDTVKGYTYSSVYAFPLSDKLVMNTFSFANPTLGDGTMRAIVTYSVRTFGA